MVAGVRMSDPDLFAGYPNAPGWKARDTSRAAAEAIKPRAMSLRARVYESLRQAPGTPEDVAERLGEPVMNIRPRCSELSARGMIEETQQRGPAMGGRRAIVWRVVA